jgi:hypothetical protein
MILVGLCHDLSGVVEVACLRVKRTRELLYKSYRFFKLVQTIGPTTGCHGLSGAVEVTCLRVDC